MTTTELEQAVLSIIRELYCKEYISKLKVTELIDNEEHIGYILELALNNAFKPLSIIVDGSELDFLKRIRKELQNRRLDATTYSIGFMKHG